MGFHPALPIVVDEVANRRRVDSAYEHAAWVARTGDPFGIDEPCTHPEGHCAIACCGDVVCCHCAKVFWQ